MTASLPLSSLLPVRLAFHLLQLTHFLSSLSSLSLPENNCLHSNSSLSGLPLHQAQDFDSVEQHGGRAFVLLYLVTIVEGWVLPWGDWAGEDHSLGARYWHWHRTSTVVGRRAKAGTAARAPVARTPATSLFFGRRISALSAPGIAPAPALLYILVAWPRADPNPRTRRVRAG